MLQVGELFVLAIDRERTESLNIDLVRSVFADLKERKCHARQSVVFCFEGFDDTPEEIYAIKPIRKYIAKIFKEYPYFFYLVNPTGGLPGVLAACLGDVWAVQRDSEKVFTAKVTLSPNTIDRILIETLKYGVGIGDSPLNILDTLLVVPGIL